MMLLTDHRIELDPRPTPTQVTVLPVVMLGHCPGEARWERLVGDNLSLAEIAALGLQREVDRLTALSRETTVTTAATEGAPGPHGETIVEEAQGQAATDARLKDLYDLPLPLYSLGQFQALFPDAFEGPTRYRSRLAGDQAWLPLAVQDFFDSAAPLPAGAKKLWIIRVDEDAEREAFLPNPEANLLDASTLPPFERALLIPEVGILALPDLERLQIPVNLEGPPGVRLPNPDPVFLPCGTPIDDSHRERRHPSEMPRGSLPFPPEDIIPPILRALGRYRPDMQCLLALPFDPDAEHEAPQPSASALDLIARIAGLHPDTGDGPHGELFARLRHVELLFPYLRGPDRRLASPCGPVAGMQAEISQRQGPWRSMAGRPLSGRSLPYPPLDQHQATRLRETPGIGVLIRRNNGLELDDERLAGPVVQLPAFRSRHDTVHQDEHYRSGEVARFLGWLRRELTALGEGLLFDVDPRDPRPIMALTGFFTRLHARGALRGRLPEQAFSIRRQQSPEGVLAFDIEIAPAFPIDRIRLTFVQDRNAGEGGSRLEVTGA